nr:MAG TPA: hypothetical protein [Caudoviricetes sp.]
MCPDSTKKIAGAKNGAVKKSYGSFFVCKITQNNED